MKSGPLECQRKGCINPWTVAESLVSPAILQHTVGAGLGALCAQVGADAAGVWLSTHRSLSPEPIASHATSSGTGALFLEAANGWLKKSFGRYLAEPALLFLRASGSSGLAVYPVCTAVAQPAGCLMMRWPRGSERQSEDLHGPLAAAAASVGGLLERHRLGAGLLALSEAPPSFSADLFRWAAKMAADVVHAPHVLVWELDSEAQTLVHVRSNTDAIPESVDIPLGSGIIGSAAQHACYGRSGIGPERALNPRLVDELRLTQLCWCWVERAGERRALLGAYGCGNIPFSDTEELLVRAAASRFGVLLAGEGYLDELRRLRERVQRRAGAVLGGLGALELVHDISMHMHAVNSWVRWICTDLVPRQKQQQPQNKAALDDFKKGLDAVTDLTRRLTRLAKAGSPLQRRLQPIKPILESVRAVHEAELERDKIVLSVTDRTEGVEVNCDADRIQQVISNLISNAQFALRGQKGKREVSVRAEVSGDRQVLMSVEDSGPGIVQEDLDSIFEIGVSTKPPDQGAGFGLYVVKTLVERHGGSVEAKSIRPHGARFEVRLPSEV